MHERLYYMYVLRCSDDTLYTGYTTDVDARIDMHNKGKGAKYTRSRRPVMLEAHAGFSSKHDAMSAEYHFKRLDRQSKESMISQCHDCASFTERLSSLIPSTEEGPFEEPSDAI